MTNAAIATLAALAIEHEDWTQTEREVFYVVATFGSRCFVHFTPYRSASEASPLLARIRAAAPSADHILTSLHWEPHPYCDGTLEQRLTVEGIVEAEERAAAEIVERYDAEDRTWAADRAATHADSS